jgi:hypothetical protein
MAPIKAFSILLLLIHSGQCSYHHGFANSLDSVGVLQTSGLRILSYPSGWTSPCASSKQRGQQDFSTPKHAMNPTSLENGLSSEKFRDHSPILRKNSNTNLRSSPIAKSKNGIFGMDGTEALARTSKEHSFCQSQQPLIAMCFDFDQTLSQAHIHHLRKSSEGLFSSSKFVS